MSRLPGAAAGAQGAAVGRAPWRSVRLAALALLAGCLAAAACDAPSAPARQRGYAFTLPTPAGDAVLRWPAGARVRVALAPGSAAAANLGAALDAAIQGWNAGALYGEYELVRVAAPAAADVVLAGSDAPLPVDVSACPPSGPGLALTTFCLASGGRALALLPLAPGGGGQVKMLVTVLASAAADPAAARRLVAHELGHVLGIGRHSPDPRDLMAVNPTSQSPGPADLATVLALYHTPATVLP